MAGALLVERDSDIRALVRRRLRRHGFEVTTCASPAEAEPLLESLRPALVVIDTAAPGAADAELPGLYGGESAPQVVVLSGTDTVETAVEAMRRGAVDVLAKPPEPGRLDEALRKVKANLRDRAEMGSLREQLRRLGRFGRLVGRSQPMQEIYDLVARVAPTDSTVMILGETGTGKEVVARTLHERSERSDGPFIPVNCGAIAPNLIESELLGHEKGAFTGAAERRPGLFEAASGGTLFLDEIAEMPVDLQTRLLRVLESGSVRRLGGRRAIRVDARVIAATNRDPDEAVRSGELREDLLYRLMVFPLRIPALRDRREDIPLLAEHLLGELNRDLRRDLSLAPDAIDVLTSYAWPGNVRELRNVLERSCILADRRIEAADLPLGRDASAEPVLESTRPAARASSSVGKTIREVERDLILATLEHCDGHRSRAAEMLGISVKTLYNRLRSYRDDEAS